MQEHKKLREEIIKAATRNILRGTSEERLMAAEHIADEVMDAITESFRSITEAESIVKAVQAGAKVQIAYHDSEEDGELSGIVMRPCWGEPSLAAEQAFHDLARKQEYLDGYHGPGGVPEEVMEAASRVADEIGADPRRYQDGEKHYSEEN